MDNSGGALPKAGAHLYVTGMDTLDRIKAYKLEEIAARKAAVIVVSAEATAAAIIGARDGGAHEFLRRPFTFNDLMRRLETVARQIGRAHV